MGGIEKPATLGRKEKVKPIEPMVEVSRIAKEKKETSPLRKLDGPQSLKDLLSVENNSEKIFGESCSGRRSGEQGERRRRLPSCLHRARRISIKDCSGKNIMTQWQLFLAALEMPVMQYRRTLRSR